MAESLPATQRAYTLRLRGADPDDESWREALWRTHEAVNKGAKAFGDWLLTLRGGLSHELADEPVKAKGGRRQPSADEKRDRRIVLALSWLSVESERGAPQQFIVASGKDNDKQRQHKLVKALRDILQKRGVGKAELDEWVKACEGPLGAAIREDAVWVNRSAAFDQAVKRIGKSLSRDQVWDLLERFFGSKNAYLAPIVLKDEAEPSEKAKDLVQKAGQWLSSRFGKGKGAKFEVLSGAYQEIERWAKSARPSSPAHLMAHLARLLKAPSEDLDGVLSIISGPGYKSATRNLLKKLSGQQRVSSEDLARLAKTAADDRVKCKSKVGEKGKRPWADTILEDVQRACGFKYIPDGGPARHRQFAVMLDHAARRVSVAHTWIKRAEAKRRSFEEDARKIGQVPSQAKQWLDDFCLERSRSSGSLEGYRIRKRAADGWEHVVSRWAGADCTTVADRIAVVRELQSDPEIDKFGDIQLFEALAEDDATCVWKPEGEPDPQPLKDYVAAKDAEFKRRRFKVPAYRHPDPLLHPIFCDFGCSRWDIKFDVHEAYKRKERKSTQTQTNPHGLTMRLWDGTDVSDVRLRWRTKRLFGDLNLGGAGAGKDVSRADRLGRAAAGAQEGEAVQIAGLFEDKDWNGRLQAPRPQLDAIARRVDAHGWDKQAVRMRARLEWLLTFSARLRPRGPWTEFAKKNDLRPDPVYWPHAAENKNRQGRGRLILSRLPGLRLLSVDLGHRYAAACAVWEAVSAEAVKKACKEAGHPNVKEDDLYLHLKRKDQGKLRTTIYRRIGADRLGQPTPRKEVAHPAPWARLERQFLIKLQGEDETPRKARKDEFKAVENLERELGRERSEADKLPHRIDELMSEAVRTVRLALGRHGNRARIAHYLVATEKTMPGGVVQSLDQSGRVRQIAYALELWYELAASSKWKDDWAAELWEKQAWAKDVPLQKRDEETVTRQALKKEKKERCGKLEAAAENLLRDGARCRDLSARWAKRWGEEDKKFRERLRWLRDWILPRGKKAAKNPAIRHVGGLSLTRLATIRSLWQVQKAFFTRMTPEGRRRDEDGRPLTAGEGFGQKVLDALDRMRDQRVKQLASRIVEAALGVGKEQEKCANRDPRRPRECVFEPCHAIVIENLTNYRPEETRTRRENRQLMRWSAGKVKKYLSELCQLHGLHLREVGAEYTSRQDSRTGAPGIRCQDVPVREFMRSPFWRKQVAQAEKKLEKGEGGARERLLCELNANWKDSSEKELKEAGVIRVPLNSGEIFVSADAKSPAAKGLQADLNAAANIGLRALLDPDWPGAWWYVPCDAKTMKPSKEEASGSAAVDMEKPLVQVSEAKPGARGGRGKSEKPVVNLWRDVSARALEPGDWRRWEPYWNDVSARVVRLLRKQQGLPDFA